MITLERDIVNIGRDDFSRVVRPAAGHRKHQIECLERLDGRIGDDDGGRRRKQRPGDASKRLPFAGAFDFRHFIQLFWDGLEPRDKDDQHLSRMEPDLRDGQRENRDIGVAEPVLCKEIKADELQHLIQDAHRRIVDKRPDERHRHRRQDGREEIKCPEKYVRFRVLDDDQCKSERHQCLEHDDCQHELQVIADRFLENRIARKCAGVVVDADKLEGGAQAVPVSKRIKQGADGWI